MNLITWLHETPQSEIDEALVETDGTMGELIGVYKKKRAMNTLNMSGNISIANAFEGMLETAKDYHDEQAAYNDLCPRCEDNGMNCTTCGGTGKRDSDGERAAYLYDQKCDEKLMELKESEQ